MCVTENTVAQQNAGFQNFAIKFRWKWLKITIFVDYCVKMFKPTYDNVAVLTKSFSKFVAYFYSKPPWFGLSM